MESIDCVVVGAGFYGLAAAKHYRCSQPGHSVAQASIGGTWAEERLYPGLKTNNIFGTYQYPDFPMQSGRFGAEPGEHMPGRAVHEYLKAYAQHFDIAGIVRLNTKILSAEHQENKEGGWLLTVETQGRTSTLFAQRLIVASGLTSEPNMLRLVGQEEFGGPVFHGREFRQNDDTVKAGQRAVVYGSNKFAWDAAYAYAVAGAEVHWVIRDNGHGPCWMTPPYVTPLKQRVEFLANTRLLTWFSPSIWGSQDGHPWIRRLLHGTAIGRFVTNMFWTILASDVLALCGFDSHPETKKLKPSLGAMFAGTSFSILNYESDFFDLVRSGRIKVHTAEIDRLSRGNVHLSDGTCFEADSVLVHSGWKKKPPIRFLPDGLDAELGLPHEPQGQGALTPGSQMDVLEKADREILSLFPRLRDQPASLKGYVPLAKLPGVADSHRMEHNALTPFMLHRFMVPPSRRFLQHRDVAFCGMAMNFSTPIMAHVQSMWVAGFMAGNLHRDPAADVSAGALEELQYQTVLSNRFGKWRYPVDWGNKAPSFIFDAVPYYDMLLRDLGLPCKRKGFWADLFQAYGPEDYCDTTVEWMAKCRA